MHKKLLIITLTLLFCSVMLAQEQQDRWVWPDEHIEDALFLHIGIGPKLGAGLDKATDPSFSDFHFKSGIAYQLGAVVNIHVAHHLSLSLHGIDHIGLAIEALYEQRNFNAGDETMTMKCFETPLLLQFFLPRNFQLEAGLTLVKLLGITPDSLQAGYGFANVGAIKGSDVMISAGACYRITFGLTLDLRYNYGMSEWAENFRSKTSTVMFSLNYMFPLMK